MEFATGAAAAVVTVIFTNPMDVIKTRLQLQGELQARKQHVIHYKNTLHAAYAIFKNDGYVALQKGLVPAGFFQAFFNGIRLGTFGMLQDWGWNRRSNGDVSVTKTLIISIFSGCLGSFVASPFYLIKTHLQSQSFSHIAVGYQHSHTGMVSALAKIYRTEGIRGLWRGASSSFPRVGVGSATQMVAYSKGKELLEKHQILSEHNTLWNTVVAGMFAGVFIAFFMTPFDVLQTRLYNQGVDKNGKGILYTGVVDCSIKMLRTEGPLSFFKGFFPCYLRIGPHSLLCLFFWDAFKEALKKKEE